MKIELRTDNYNSKVTWIFYNNRVAIKQPSQTFTLKAMCIVDNNFTTNSQNIYISTRFTLYGRLLNSSSTVDVLLRF